MNYTYHIGNQKLEKITDDIKEKITDRFIAAIPNCRIVDNKKEKENVICKKQ